jgi:hypothetical protein
MINLLTAFAQAVVKGLELANRKESRKYLDEALELQRDLTNEYLKPEKHQSDLTILTIERRLFDLNKILQEYKPTLGSEPDQQV